MATTLESNLYPPIVDTFMPAFLQTESCKVYFNLTDYNQPEDIKHAQITLVYQTTNKNALNITEHRNAIKIQKITQENNRYYITLDANDLSQPAMIEGDKAFPLNTFYKVQIRFSGIEAPSLNPPASWYTENLSSFSEWSTICIIKAIKQPVISLKTSGMILSDSATTTIPVKTLQVIGSLSYDGATGLEAETLDHYNLTIKKNSVTIISSEEIYTNQFSNANEINYTFKKKLDNGTYNLIINYTTMNGYKGSKTYSIKIDEKKGEAIPGASISANLESDNGRIKVRCSASENFSKSVIISRACIDTDFQEWEDIFTFTNTTVDKFTWYDYTVEGGKFYVYAMQYFDAKTNMRGTETECKESVLAIFDDIFITSNDIQLKISYNQNINSIKQTVSVDKVDTIGSKYPFIRKNGTMNYKTFTISGIISCISDENRLFMTDEEAYYNSTGTDLYQKYNLNNGITRYRDFIYEKRFRDKATEFLNKAQVLLFRSLTEGNIMIKTLDVSMTPNQQLGRLIWSVSISAVEVDDCTLDNIFKYEVQSKEGSISAKDDNIIYSQSGSSMLHSVTEKGITTLMDSGIDKDLLNNDSITNNNRQ